MRGKNHKLLVASNGRITPRPRPMRSVDTVPGPSKTPPDFSKYLGYGEEPTPENLGLARQEHEKRLRERKLLQRARNMERDNPL